MKVKIDKIDEGKYVVRETVDQEYIAQIKASFEKDGQWNPLILRQSENQKYDIIAGHSRLQAAKELGWTEIEANIIDVSDIEADMLSLKTNLIRLEMSAREQGKVLYKMVQNYNINASELAKIFNVSPGWVNTRIKLALKLHDNVVNALEQDLINFGVASVIASLDLKDQTEFLDILVKKKTNQPSEATKLKNIFLNDTVYTIGYQGRNLIDFIEILKKNGIKNLYDIRFSNRSERKPEFSEIVLKRAIEHENIKYVHIPELGLPYNIQNPYKEQALKYECVKQWYYWNIENEFDFENFIQDMKKNGKTVLMCMEKYAKAMKDQKISCHRHILTEYILNYESKDELYKFYNRNDL